MFSMSQEQIQQLQSLSETFNKLQLDMHNFQQTNPGQSPASFLKEMEKIQEQIQSIYNLNK